MDPEGVFMVGRGKSGLLVYLPIIALVVGIGGTVAGAAPLCTAAATTAARFESLGNGGCQFGDKVFFNFTYTYTLADSSGLPLVPNVPGSAVAVQFSAVGGPFQPVVSFISIWDVINGEQGDIRITYDVSAPPAAAMFSSALTIRGSVSNVDPDNQFSSVISGAESICCPGPGNAVVPIGVVLNAPLVVSGLVPGTSADQAFYPATTLIGVQKDIFLDAGTDATTLDPPGLPGGPPNGNEARLTRIDQRITELTSLPEPRSFFLFGSGLISLVFLTKRVRKLNKKLNPIDRRMS
jgi:hypothetical protein